MIEKTSFARGALEVTRLGLGTAPLGGMYRPVSYADAYGTIRAAWDAGIRYFDTAPMYGLTRCEHLVGSELRRIAEETGQSDWVISTKAGRLLRHARPGSPLPPAAPRNPFDSGWHSGLGFNEVFDYTYDGIMRSYEDSQQRLGLERIDILLIHDIGTETHGPRQAKHWADLTAGGGFRALDELRSGGYVKAVGLGVNEWQIIREALDVFDLDCSLLAGRYSLLDQGSLREFLPVCVERKVSIVAAGVFNSGILVSNDAKFNYADAPPAIVERAGKLKALAREHGVPLPAAAVHFALAHPAIAAIVVGARTPGEITQTAAWYETSVPATFWQALRKSGLVDETAPLPGSA